MGAAMPLPEIDAEGYLVDPQDWTEEIAQEFARHAVLTTKLPGTLRSLAP